MRRTSLLFLLLIALAFVLGVKLWRRHLPSRPRWQPVAPGLEMWSQSLNDGQFVALRTTPARVHIAARGQLLNASDWRKQCKALAAINGGFFDLNHQSLGIRIADGQKLSGSSGGKGGVFYVQAGRARIAASTDFAPNPHISQAVQCGPRLVEGGQSQRLKLQYARRTGIGIRRDGRVVIAVADGDTSLPAWARLWASPEGLNCIDALNLDGGPSTQLSLHAGSINEEIPGGWPVPDAVVIR